ncbi:response regulator [Cupriavidus sp. 30B13]|uniref:response regulator n=1 Tax=Cupriavidus sp. 30B13 TaxID=3384241 RepID=UPI003B8F41E3
MNPPTTEPLTVLVLEHAPMISARLTRMLRAMSEVELLASSREPRAAMLAALILLPDVVILALPLRRGAGMRALRELARMRRQATIIVLSNCSIPPMRHACMQAGASFFFDKTMELDALRGALLGLAAQKQATRLAAPESSAAY